MTGQDAVNAADAFDEALGHHRRDAHQARRRRPRRRGALRQGRDGQAHQVRRRRRKARRHRGLPPRPHGRAAFSAWATCSRSSKRRSSCRRREEGRRSWPRSSSRTSFTLNDYLDQLQQHEEHGLACRSIAGMMPGLDAKRARRCEDRRESHGAHRGDHPLHDARTSATTRIDPATPAASGASPRARASSVEDVNRLLKQFDHDADDDEASSGGGKGNEAHASLPRRRNCQVRLRNSFSLAQAITNITDFITFLEETHHGQDSSAAEWARRKLPSTASSWPTAASPATAASSRRSATYNPLTEPAAHQDRHRARQVLDRQRRPAHRHRPRPAEES